MTATRDRLILTSLIVVDGVAAASLGLDRFPVLVFLWGAAQYWLRLFDTQASPRLDSRLAAGALAIALSAGLWGIICAFDPHLDPLGPLPYLQLWALSQSSRQIIGWFCRWRAQPVVIAGVGPRARELALAIRRANYPELRLLGFQAHRGRTPFNLPLNPSLGPDVRVLDSSELERDESGPEDLLVVGDLKIRPAEGPGDGLSRALKRCFDTLVILFFLPIVVPVFFVVLVINRLVQGPAPLHRQQRVTRRSKLFYIYKFRSMPRDAEPLGKPIWPAAEDPRISAFGRVLRGTWLDELPQLFNVLRGDLSLVGPRPERPEFVQVFKVSLPRYTLRHRTRAGITGLAQVRGFVGNTSLRKRRLSDRQYLDNWSIGLDVAILGWTLCQAFKRQKRQRFDYVPGDQGPIP